MRAGPGLSPTTMARIAGVLYLIIVVFGAYAQPQTVPRAFDLAGPSGDQNDPSLGRHSTRGPRHPTRRT
jgi:hypothetical protein